MPPYPCCVHCGPDPCPEDTEHPDPCELCEAALSREVRVP